ncbi:MAG: hypothetical protein AAGC68_08390, partial [Verrucomicrobiota bacterium]
LKNCRACHGDYQRTAEGLPVFAEPRWVSIDKVATDSERLDIKSPELLERIQTGPLSDLMGPKITDRGYFAPRLEGIWARYPYLHNASVPTLAHLLQPPEKRPRTFSLVDAGEAHRFDAEKVGLTTRNAPLRGVVRAAAATAGKRSIYDTRRLGHSSQGHNFGIDLSADEKRHLIEYLKTL